MNACHVTVYGSRECPDTTRATALLHAKKIPFEFRDVDENPEFDAELTELCRGGRTMPTILVNDETLINPQPDELRRAIDGCVPAV